MDIKNDPVPDIPPNPRPDNPDALPWPKPDTPLHRRRLAFRTFYGLLEKLRPIMEREGLNPPPDGAAIAERGKQAPPLS